LTIPEANIGWYLAKEETRFLGENGFLATLSEPDWN
jgi:hypothetical protein